MNILYCGDRNTEKGILLSVLSLLEHVSEPLQIYLLTMTWEKYHPISIAFSSRLEGILRRDGKGGFVRRIDCSSIFISDPPTANLGTRFTPYCMLRLYADLVPGLPDRLLYLDYDVVCLADPTGFYYQNIEDVEFVAVPDNYGQRVYSRMTAWNGKYVNSGVLLMNMAFIREWGLLQECRELCRSEKMFLPDQHALNRCALSAFIAPRRFNDQRRTHPDTVFRHYSTTFRAFPWIHTVAVKPWETEKMHKLLKDYSMDQLVIRMEKEMNAVSGYENPGAEKETIPVFFTIDDNYAPWLAVAVNSIRQNASPRYDYHIVVLHENLSEGHCKRIEALSAPGFKVELVPMQEKFEGIESDFIGNKLRADYFTLTIYFRLFIPDMFPQYSRGIYLDSDIVVPGDLARLYETPLGDNLIGACPDFSIQEVKPLTDYVTKAVGVDRAIEYINSGILLMDLEKLRQVGLGKRFLELLNKYHFDCIAPDQDYLNALCKGKIKFLAEEWDAMPNDHKPQLENPQIIHYNLFAKPWCYDNIQYADYFWYYAASSGYEEVIRLFKDNYSEAQKLSDSESLQRLVGRGQMLSELPEGTFRGIFNTGKEARL
jgi:lipopolysaccharide biosynthesis glycosyltransferase